MGNRAVIITESADMGLYLHWDGSPNQVQAFLSFCELMGYRSPETDGYGWAQLAKVIGNYIDENKRSRGLSIGLFSIRSPQHSPKNTAEFRAENDSLRPKGGTSLLSPEQIAAISPGDNGIYIIRQWKILQHLDCYQENELLPPSALLAWLEDINDCQPYQLPKEELEAYVQKKAGAL